MSYRKVHNTHSNWLKYCSKNERLIERLELPEWVFQSEANFREFVTSGKLGVTEVDDEKFDFNLLESSRFWILFDFINEYFEMDISLFDEFEKVRLKK